MVLSEKKRSWLKRKHLKPDLAIYEHFLAKFNSEVHAFGAERMQLFKAQLEELDKYVVEKCGIATLEKGVRGKIE